MTPIEREIATVRSDPDYRNVVRKWAQTYTVLDRPFLSLTRLELLAVVKVLLKEDMQ